MLQNAVAKGSVSLAPARPRAPIKAAFRAEKAGALVRLDQADPRCRKDRHPRGAMDTLRIAEGPKDVARAARLAEAQGGKTRAIMKLLGRGALLLVGGMFDLALWLFGAALRRCSACCPRSRRRRSA